MLIDDAKRGTIQVQELQKRFIDMKAEWEAMGAKITSTVLGNGEKFTVHVGAVDIVHTIVTDRFTTSFYID